MMMPSLDFSMNAFAVSAVAGLAVPKTKREMELYRTAICTTLGAAGLDMDGIAEPDAPFKSPKHALLVWHDVNCDAIRLFAPPVDTLDDTSTQALDLLNGSRISNLDAVPIEDLDAATRIMALMGAGGDDAGELYARFVAPHLHRYDDEFTPPDADDLAELWNQVYAYYIGGTNFAPTELDAWIAKAYAFGIGFAT